MTTGEIIIVIIASVLLLGLIAVVALLMKKKPEAPSDRYQFESMGEIKTKIDQVNSTIPLVVSNALGKEMLSVTKSLGEQGESNSLRLSQFRRDISETIDKRFGSLSEQVEKKLNDINKKVEERLEGGFKNTNETFGKVIERLAKIDEAQKNIDKLSSNVVSLQTILEGNQSRGQYGEFQLSMILHNVFGDVVGCYAEQYVLRKGKNQEDDVRPDAVVFLPPPNGMICIDSKFPFQSYRQIFENDNSEGDLLELKRQFRVDVKKHIGDIKNKYIIKGKTAEQALMFIPSDGVFAYMHVELYDLIEEALKSSVIVTSPSTLQAILATMNMLRVNHERSKNLAIITEQLNRLAKDFEKFSGDWEKLSKNISGIKNTKDSLDKRVELMTGKFNRISQGSQPEQIIENDGEAVVNTDIREE